jgi:hypothetical protein
MKNEAPYASRGCDKKIGGCKPRRGRGASVAHSACGRLRRRGRVVAITNESAVVNSNYRTLGCLNARKQRLNGNSFLGITKNRLPSPQLTTLTTVFPSGCNSRALCVRIFQKNSRAGSSALKHSVAVAAKSSRNPSDDSIHSSPHLLHKPSMQMQDWLEA